MDAAVEPPYLRESDDTKPVPRRRTVKSYPNLPPAVFLDRDGTLIEDRGHLRSPSEVVLFPETVGALRRLQSEFLLFIVTNQSGVAEGTISIDDVDRVNSHLLDRLAENGVDIAATYVCSHRRINGCACIKPKPYFLYLAAQEYGVDLRRSFVVGDHPHDVELATNAGARGIYVCTGHGMKHFDELPDGEVVLANIGEAADWILSHRCTSRRVRDIRRVGEALRLGGVVAFPTETVYVLGADALNPQAVAQLFEIKGRPVLDPLIVHVANRSQATSLVKDFPAQACALANRFWPGSLTLVLPKKDTVPDIVTGGLSTVALCVPDHPVALQLIWEAGVPIAAPSANLFGHTSPTTAIHVAEQLGDRVDEILDGGPCRVGVESTIVSFVDERPLLLRPGGVPLEEIEAVVGPVTTTIRTTDGSLCPRILPRHYAPRTPLALCNDVECVPPGKRVGLMCLDPPANIDAFAAVEVLSERRNLREAAANLYAALRRLDECDLDFILALPVPETDLGLAIMDRLRKASRPMASALTQL